MHQWRIRLVRWREKKKRCVSDISIVFVRSGMNKEKKGNDQIFSNIMLFLVGFFNFDWLIERNRNDWLIEIFNKSTKRKECRIVNYLLFYGDWLHLEKSFMFVRSLLFFRNWHLLNRFEEWKYVLSSSFRWKFFRC